MKCSEVQERLSLFHDNELSQDEAVRVAAHVTDCSSCAAEIASFEQLTALSRQLTDPLAPVRLWDELHSKLNDSAAPKKILSGFQPNPIPGRLLVPGRSLVL